jgi:hypothetical protein
MENSLELLEEVRKHGVYTAFSFNFEKGELEYVSPMYKFEIDKETGELVAIGETYTPEETINSVVSNWLVEKTAEINQKMAEIGDYIVETGFIYSEVRINNNFITNIAWCYEKRKSGIAKCWARLFEEEIKVKCETQKGSLYIMDSPIVVSFPFEFKSIYKCICSGGSARATSIQMPRAVSFSVGTEGAINGYVNVLVTASQKDEIEQPFECCIDVAGLWKTYGE